MIFDADRPVVIGHRGAGSGEVLLPGEAEAVTENTVESILGAVRAGATWVEIDVTRTADDELVLRHDPTGADGAFLIDRTAAESGLPRLVDVFDALPPEVALDVDVKTVLEDAVDPPARRTGALLAPLLAAESRRRPLMVTSFDPSLLLGLREELDGVPLGLLTWLRFPLWHAIAAASGLGLDAVGVHTGSCGFDSQDTRLRPLDHNVDVAHKAGLEVLAWCPAPADSPRYAAAGVDALVVNDVPGAISALTSSGEPDVPDPAEDVVQD
ncbi:glycerophosphoryl diester phosphodiesterase [Thermomonospora echinospora]|uniref:Glycerophosphoryl diester phosphodiesterase n=1 Tax=Thermomonospora echinospora TaxID=1992 RepID=A0A1H6E108_9ACTN|nr:glycerophosphodiester phosphodiesterase [Thermomonospora echinospora]SEG90853.1 glycerophosphoryl diester phosphodiesterase [Thermomonospora echinospora]